MMDEKIKELIAIGASVGAHCQPCLTYHVNKAKDVGVEEDEIREAISMGNKVEKGSMAAMRQFSGSLLDASPEKAAGCCGDGDNPNGCA